MNNYDLNFKYHLYERERITAKMKKVWWMAIGRQK
jgi:hypothetical protein